jgi:L-malate glycosyltransferase
MVTKRREIDNMSPKTILIIENSIDVTGALNGVLRTSIALRSQFNFIFVVPNGSKATQAVGGMGFMCFELPMFELNRSWQAFLLYIPRLIVSVIRIRKISKRQNVALVHVNDFYNMIMPMARLLGSALPYICYVNFIPDRFPIFLRKIWINSHMYFADRIVGVSGYVVRQLPVHNKVIQIPVPLPVKNDPGFSVIRKNRFLYLGNFIEGKGQDSALRAFAIVSEKCPGWTLRLVGGDMGMEKNRKYHLGLKSLARELKVEERIEWSGFSKDAENEFRDASVALNFSRSESFSLTVQEAMYYGCPVIATKSGGPSEIIDDKKTGILVDVGDIEAMTSAMITIAQDKEFRDMLGVAAYASVRQKFSYENTSGKLGAVYTQAFLKMADRV